jgi:iron complex transport system ATP-binding protein
VGPNGAGKSSLLLVLAGALAPASGTVLLDGRKLAAWQIEDLAALRACVQDRWFDPFPIRVDELLAAARFRLRGLAADSHAGRARLAECLSAMDCAQLAARDARTLSRGERQRVALAAGLAQDAALVLLDEPVAHQDPRHQRTVLDRLAVWPGSTFIGALHDMNAALRFATHALLLHGDGRWRSGSAVETLTAESLSELFQARIVRADSPSGPALVLA